MEQHLPAAPEDHVPLEVEGGIPGPGQQRFRRARGVHHHGSAGEQAERRRVQDGVLDRSLARQAQASRPASTPTAGFHARGTRARSGESGPRVPRSRGTGRSSRTRASSTTSPGRALPAAARTAVARSPQRRSGAAPGQVGLQLVAGPPDQVARATARSHDLPQRAKAAALGAAAQDRARRPQTPLFPARPLLRWSPSSRSRRAHRRPSRPPPIGGPGPRRRLNPSRTLFSRGARRERSGGRAHGVLEVVGAAHSQLARGHQRLLAPRQPVALERQVGARAPGHASRLSGQVGPGGRDRDARTAGTRTGAASPSDRPPRCRGGRGGPRRDSAAGPSRGRTRASSAWKLDTSQTTTTRGPVCPTSDESGVPTFPATATGQPAARRTAPSISAVVVLPLVPVTAMKRFGSSRHASSSSPNTGMPRSRAAAIAGAVPGTPGLLHHAVHAVEQIHAVASEVRLDPLRMPGFIRRQHRRPRPQDAGDRAPERARPTTR